jgi:hypothetical protein
MTETTADTGLPELPAHGHARLWGHTAWDSLRTGAYLYLEGTPDSPGLHAEKPGSGSYVSIRPSAGDLARFAREILAFLGEDNGLALPPWQPASNGAGKRHWFLIRGAGAESDRVPVRDRYYLSAADTLVRYASYSSAQRAAAKLNAAEKRTTPESGALDAIAAILSGRYPSSGWQEAMEQRQDVIRVLQGTGRMEA